MAKLKITGTVNDQDLSITIECENDTMKNQIRSAICRVLSTSIDVLTAFEVKVIP